MGIRSTTGPLPASLEPPRIGRRQPLDAPLVSTYACLRDRRYALVTVVDDNQVSAGRKLAQHRRARRHSGSEGNGVSPFQASNQRLKRFPSFRALVPAVDPLRAEHVR